jgi:hypothetical protein
MDDMLDIGHNPQLQASGGVGGSGGSSGGKAVETAISLHLLAAQGPGKAGYIAAAPVALGASTLLSSIGVKRGRNEEAWRGGGGGGNKAAALAAVDAPALLSSHVAPSSSIVARGVEQRLQCGGAVHPLARPFSASAAVGLVGHVENNFIAAYLR